ncbi:hypothetical protein IW262DRAFT_1528970 [Armillaria fumosa]|nr:hypothetical protein IW262DRAFT_1528970 [Armillaria fumosa]
MTATIAEDRAILQMLSDGQAKDVFHALDTQLNSMIAEAFSHGIYTGVMIATLWTVVSSKRQHNYRGPRSILLMIVLLYLLTTIGLSVNWAANTRIFIVNGQNFAMVFKAYNSPLPSRIYLVVGIAAGASTILTDATLFTIDLALLDHLRPSFWCYLRSSAFHHPGRSKSILLYQNCVDSNPENTILYAPNSSRWAVIYSSAIWATLLWCTVLIVYRILSVAIEPRWYICAIEITVESASLYSALIIVLLVLEARNDAAGMYVEALAIAMRGIVPTMQVCRVASGCARPDNYWSGSLATESLRFRTLSASEQSLDGMSFDGTVSLLFINASPLARNASALPQDSETKNLALEAGATGFLPRFIFGSSKTKLGSLPVLWKRVSLKHIYENTSHLDFDVSAHEILTQAGSLLEIEVREFNGRQLKVWKNQPPTMREFYLQVTEEYKNKT